MENTNLEDWRRETLYLIAAVQSAIDWHNEGNPPEIALENLRKVRSQAIERLNIDA